MDAIFFCSDKGGTVTAMFDNSSLVKDAWLTAGFVIREISF